MFAEICRTLLPSRTRSWWSTTPKCLPARLIGRKESGGRVEFLLLTPLALIRGRAQRRGRDAAQPWPKGCSRPPRDPDPARRFIFRTWSWTVLEKGEFGSSQGSAARWTRRAGRAFPEVRAISRCPPYIRREDTPEDQTRYQTVYSREDKLGSVAAPTAGLHFTPEIMAALAERGIRTGRGHPLRGLRHLQPGALRRHPRARHARRVRRGAGGNRPGHRQQPRPRGGP
jgi:S-adenosylmethionine:tRNA ribosyltransferase-isomerase